jgi:predicted deacylase
MIGRIKIPVEEWFGETIAPGESRNIHLPVSESFSSSAVHIPIHVRRAKAPGPVVFITAALHGDEINGTGAIRQLIQGTDMNLLRGSVIMIPVLNILAFDRHSRYLPDRRDLNRSFPGSPGGSLASRMANLIFEEIVARSDYGIDLHTAAVRRTNYPNVRGDMSRAQVAELAKAFGAEIIMDGKGPDKSLRREACRAGCPTIIMEGGEVWKVEPGIVESATRGIQNVLHHLGMLDGPRRKPPFQIVIESSKWIRADNGGFLQFHVQPGEIVDKDQPLASNTTLLGETRNTLVAPFHSVVIGMTSLPAVSPGEPICNLGRLPDGVDPDDLRDLRAGRKGLSQRLSSDLATNVLVVEHDNDDIPASGTDQD